MSSGKTAGGQSYGAGKKPAQSGTSLKKAVAAPSSSATETGSGLPADTPCNSHRFSKSKSKRSKKQKQASRVGSSPGEQKTGQKSVTGYADAAKSEKGRAYQALLSQMQQHLSGFMKLATELFEAAS